MANNTYDNMFIIKVVVLVDGISTILGFKFALFQGEDVIAILPWDEWWEFELKKDDSNPHIALLPLHPELRAKFNEPAAWEYAKSMSGKPYGYHNLIFSWIDTTSGNYPAPLDAHLVLCLLSFNSSCSS